MPVNPTAYCEANQRTTVTECKRCGRKLGEGCGENGPYADPEIQKQLGTFDVYDYEQQVKEYSLDLVQALQLLLNDAESEHAGFTSHGMAITNPEHPWHASIMAARAVLKKIGEPTT